MAGIKQHPLYNGQSQPTQVGQPQGGAPAPMAGQPPGGFDIMQLMQMILQSQQGQQQNLLNAINQPQQNIAQSPRNQDGGLDRWYQMNPHARQGESYQAGRNAQVQGNQAFRAQENIQRRSDLATMINRLAEQQQEFDAIGPVPDRLPVNPFFL